MKGRRHSPEQIVRKLREADRLQAEGADVDAVCRHLEISVQTYQRWRSQFKAMRPEDVVRLKALEDGRGVQDFDWGRSYVRLPARLAAARRG
jgi:putative transposase